jgi:arsenate reductase
VTKARSRTRPYRVLFLCTGNSARSQLAEAVLNRKGQGRFEAYSAGSRPAARVNPFALRVLAEGGIDWGGRQPRGLEVLDQERWDFVITVCDKAREVCPVFPGQPILAHWGMPDPAALEGDDEQKLAAFRESLILISRRIDLLVVLPIEKLERLVVAAQLQAIGEVGLALGRTSAEDLGP